MGPSAHPSMQPYTHAEVQQQDAPPPAEAPRDVVSPPALGKDKLLQKPTQASSDLARVNSLL